MKIIQQPILIETTSEELEALCDTFKQIEEITMDETITVSERISKLQQLASDLSYEHGIGNGEYHLTSDVEAVFDAIAELKK